MLINLFSSRDVNNAPKCWVDLQNDHIIVLTDLKYVYFVCQRLAYIKENQTLLIDDEVSKALWNSKCSGLFIKSFRRHKWPKNKVQWLDLVFHLWQLLIGLPLTRTIDVHYKIIVKYFKPHLNFSWNYSWFI